MQEVVTDGDTHHVSFQSGPVPGDRNPKNNPMVVEQAATCSADPFNSTVKSIFLMAATTRC